MKLLVWNIQRFTMSTIVGPPAPEGGQSDASWRLFHIFNTVTRTAPDIFVIVENQSAKTSFGQLAGGKGAAAALAVLNSLRAMSPAAEWCLVPPQCLVPNDIIDNPKPYTEVISVFFQNATLEFIGPYCWTGAGASPPGMGTPTPYTGAFAGALPAASNTYAGTCTFSATKDGPMLDFGGAAMRKPFWTRFRERQGERLLNLISIHTKPGGIEKVFAINQLADIYSLNIPPISGTNPVWIDAVVGDFNVNIVGRDNYFVAYDLLSRAGYELLIRPGLGPDNFTMLVSSKTATPTAYKRPASYDNVLVRYSGGQAQLPVGAPSAVVVDMVTGTAGCASDMTDTLAAIGNDEARFQRMDNYGHIGPNRGVSDHMPVAAVL